MTELKQFTRAEIANSGEKITRIIIHDKVYDVSKFLNEHPGGEEVLLEQAGKDASDDWDDVGHSNDAIELMKNYLIGEIVKGERKNSKPKEPWSTRNTKKQNNNDTSSSSSNKNYIIAGIFAILIAIIYLQLN
ncbi:cytochrome b5-like [Aphidius gifuensis]|uniref:cytochrome b5-like n=1 Tax=Aphidius gifuensis TaxID=684658 RepID=UPI001CDBE5AC|nr:cytochrome b5-like [Aphidius gifuensis]XP_044020683.1 cytochrome b5-like [Aphidius gifuensis]